MKLEEEPETNENLYFLVRFQPSLPLGILETILTACVKALRSSWQRHRDLLPWDIGLLQVEKTTPRNNLKIEMNVPN
jgi:hypothetical protein